MQLFGNKLHLITRDRESRQSGDERILQLIVQCKEGNKRAQKAIYDALSPKMYSLCLRYMGDRDTAQDVLQDGFVTLFTKLDCFEGNGSFEGWARKIFVNTALMSLRKNDVLKQSEDVEAARNIITDTPDAIADVGYKELMKMIAELPAGFRTVFNMYVIEGFNHKEIAERLGISETTSRSQLQRARMILQNKIKK